MLLGMILAAVGFTALGPAGGSWAAAWQVRASTAQHSHVNAAALVWATGDDYALRALAPCVYIVKQCRAIVTPVWCRSQASIGNVASGSLFSSLQAAAMVAA